MVRYNTREWFSLIFRFHKSDTFRILFPAMIITALYSWGVAWFEITYLDGARKTSSLMHSLLGFVISLLLVFRTNTAYERWWEGRKLWGTLVNSCRNIAIKANAFSPDEHEKERFASQLIAFPHALKDHLRDKYSVAEHVPLKISGDIYQTITSWHKAGSINEAQYMNLNADLTSLMDICGGCERIKRTPIPFSYSLFLKKFIFVYIMTMPFGLVKDFGYWVIIIVVFMFYVLASLELIAEEIEDPFGDDSNDLPTEEIANNIEKNVRQVLRVR